MRKPTIVKKNNFHQNQRQSLWLFAVFLFLREYWNSSVFHLIFPYSEVLWMRCLCISRFNDLLFNLFENILKFKMVGSKSISLLRRNSELQSKWSRYYFLAGSSVVKLSQKARSLFSFCSGIWNSSICNANLGYKTFSFTVLQFFHGLTRQYIFIGFFVVLTNMIFTKYCHHF